KIIVESPQGISVALCWNKTIIEDPTRQFVKDVLNLKTGIEWSFTSAIQKLELEHNTCKEEKVENQDHLAICKVYEESLIEIEDMSMDMAWSSLPNDAQMNTNKRQLKEIFWGTRREKKLETRSNIMKGLVQEKAVEVLRE
ncbi:12433_t:CDS:2, partial [Gigaspora rosea]